MRDKRGKKRKGGRSEYKRKDHKRLKHQIAAIVADIMDEKERDRGNVDSTSSSTISSKDHPALTRQGGIPKRK